MSTTNLALVLSICCFSQWVFASAAMFSYQGRLFDDNGEPVDTGNTEMTLQVLDPSGNCLLFEEKHTVIMDQTSGYFRVSVGLGTKNIATAPNFLFKDVFSNANAFNDANLGCASYSPNLSDHRLLRVTVDGETLVPDHTISSVPFSIQAGNADAVQGKTFEDITNYADQRFAGAVLPDLQATPLAAGDSFKWDGAKWVIFQPGSATGLTDVVAGNGLAETGTTTKTVDIGAGDGITVGADSITLNLGSGLQFNSGAVEVNQSAISYGNLSGLPSIPSQLSDLTGDSDNITQGSTNLFMTGAERTKLSGVAANAEVNVQSDWNAASGDAQILNKPTIPSNITDLTVGNDSISGSAIDGGVISNFASTGIDDNASAVAVTVNGSGNVGIGTTAPNARLTVDGVMTLDEQTADPTGTAGYGSVYAKNDGKLYYRDGVGTVSDLTAVGSGTVTQVDVGTGLTGGSITASGTIGLANTAVSAGAYGSATQVPTFTVDAQGRLTAAANVTITDNDTTYSAVTGVADGLMIAADKTKLDGIEASATADQTPAEILTAVKTVDGATSGLDADLLDSQSGAYYLAWANLTGVPADIADGDANTQLSEATVDSYVSDNGYLTTQSLDGAYDDGSSVTVDSTDVIYNLSSTQDFHIQDAGGAAFTVTDSGDVGIGTTSPSGALDVSSTSGALVPPRMSAAQRDALSSPPDGSVVYNTTSSKMNFREGGAWQELGSGGGGGGSGLSFSSKSSNYTITSSDDNTLFSITAISTITLPDTAAVSDGFRVIIKKMVDLGEITIDGHNSQMIEGVENKTLGFKYNHYDLVKQGSEWLVIAATDAASPTPCSGASVGDTCGGGGLYAGTFNSSTYMVTPGGCTDSALPTCAGGTDTVTKTWGASGSTTGATSNTNGATNTTTLAGGYSDTLAAQFCDSMVYGGYSDWFLPAKDELNHLYTNRVAIGGFASNWYWSSTENSSRNAWRQTFSGGSQPQR